MLPLDVWIYLNKNFLYCFEMSRVHKTGYNWLFHQENQLLTQIKKGGPTSFRVLKPYWRYVVGRSPRKRWKYFCKRFCNHFPNDCDHDQIDFLKKLLFEQPGDKYICALFCLCKDFNLEHFFKRFAACILVNETQYFYKSPIQLFEYALDEDEYLPPEQKRYLDLCLNICSNGPMPLTTRIWSREERQDMYAKCSENRFFFL